MGTEVTLQRRTVCENVATKRASRLSWSSPYRVAQLLLVVFVLVAAGCGAGVETVEQGSAVGGPAGAPSELVIDGETSSQQDDSDSATQGLNETVIGPSETVANDPGAESGTSPTTAAPAASGSESDSAADPAAPAASDTSTEPDEGASPDGGDGSAAAADADSSDATNSEPAETTPGDGNESNKGDKPADRDVVVVTVGPEGESNRGSSGKGSNDGRESEESGPSTSISDTPVAGEEGVGGTDSQPESTATTIAAQSEGPQEEDPQAASTTTSAVVNPQETESTSTPTTVGERRTTTTAEPEPGTVEDVERQFIVALNEVRLDHGLAPFEEDEGMSSTSRAWSFEMAKRGSLQHAPDITVGLPENWELAAENVGVGRSIDKLMQAFMDSDDHRVNILNSDYRVLGVGVIMTESGKIYVTHRFAKLSS